ncbi:low molecular weight protein-tyrosine-phosphatase [Rhodovulum sp. DZ06]|uniref:low molecular weight protein-tyrosine-phosphatase n=1 Tax=Rhodovulum sp. DZ06 TaxID=3425126 RepID=UPI003D348CCA
MTAPRLLFVCLGNICRSPAAEGVMRALAARHGTALELDSAGTGAWHVGNPPDPRMRAAAAARGYPIDDLRARQAEAADFHRFDMILAMDRSNFRDLRAIAPRGTEGRLSLMLSHGAHGGGDVPDPYYGGEDGFDHVLDLLEDSCAGLLEKLGR